MGFGSAQRTDDDGDRVLVAGRPDLNRCDNMIKTSKYTVWSFLPIVSEGVSKFTRADNIG